MSDSELAEKLPGDRRKNSQNKNARGWLAAGLVAVLAIITYVLLNQFSGRMPWYTLAAIGTFALIGVAGLVAYMLEIIHVGKKPEERQFFDNLLNSLDEACVVTGKRGRVIYCNNIYREMLADAGHSRLVGFENLYAGYTALSDKIYRLSRAARSGESAREEFRLDKGSSAPGAQREASCWINLSVVPVAGRFSSRYCLWRYRDVSAGRAQQEAAFAHLQYIINYLDHAPAGFFSTRANGEIAYINATLAGWLGHDLDAIGEGALALNDIAGEGTAKMLLDQQPRANGGQTSVFDIDLLGKSGEEIAVQVIHRVDFDKDGKLQPSRSLVLKPQPHDTTAIGDAGSVRFSRLMNHAPIGIAELMPDGKIKRTNVAFAGLSDAETGGADFADLIVKPTGDEINEVVRKVACGLEQSVSVNVAFKGDDDNTASVVFVRLDDAAGDVKGEKDAEAEGEKATQELAPATNENTEGLPVFAYVTDTSRRTSLEEQLAQSQKMQAVGQLAGGVAHDFNNVLTAIIGFSDLLLAKHRPSDPSFGDVMNIKQNANRAANLVRQLLAFSRRQTLRPEVHLLNDVMSDLGNLLGRLLGEKVKFNMIYGRDLGLVKVDINQFEQVVVNLAVNARDAMNAKGELTIRTANISLEESAALDEKVIPEGEYVLCEVTDTGSGMPKEVLDKIYEPFFSTKEVGKGTGLGLSTVYGIVKQTGGFIFCDSTVGKGTTFRVYLPRVYRDENEVADAVVMETKKVDMTGDATILLVEDEDAVRSFASRALTSRGFTVLEADSGEAALEVMDEHGGDIDLVLSDVVMPEMDGPSMLKEMRRRGIQTRFIFISGYAEDAFEKNLEGEEDFAFLPKPFSLKQLTGAVKEALSS